MNHSLETRYEIWNDTHGNRMAVGPDHDGLSLIEIQSFNEKGAEEKQRRIMLTEVEAVMLIEALTRTLEDFRRYRLENP